MTCSRCGYPETDHVSGRCPLCACGLTPAQHEPTPDPARRLCACGCGVPAFMHAAPGSRCWLCDARMPHACVYATYLGAPCPGRRSEAEASRGQWLELRQSTYEPAEDLPPETALWREVMARDVARRHAEADAARHEHVHTPAAPPRIPARAPRSMAEVAAGQGRQARILGRKAVEAGGAALAYYWMADDRAEGSAVRVARGDLRGVAVWLRPAGAEGWKLNVVYAWRLGSGQVPMKMSLKNLEEMLNG